MTVHVLHAGNGYTYLTRQVAHGDVGRERGKDLSDYYAEKGAPPGVWLGSGLAGLSVEGRVEERQMQALFGEGMHPDADRITTEALSAGAAPAAAVRAAQPRPKVPHVRHCPRRGVAPSHRSTRRGAWPQPPTSIPSPRPVRCARRRVQR
ncbi:relaxase domain-containing protein [Nocardioides convexus]|uniref:relaxase domain-containing protein n=1 Tax=Nocardioides convexus TaxID=2712224 RepID=UPI0024185468|nr:relaxase domain-containing protein [Nocardioides convexus]